jgi:transcriptional regulator with XRE-family HTH domain
MLSYPALTRKHAAEMTFGETKLLSNPSGIASLLPNSDLQLVSREVDSAISSGLHSTTIVLDATLRKHYCFMDDKDVRDRTFGDWLAGQLLSREWSKAEFARRLGVSNGDVSRWVRGVRIPRPDTVDKIADVLGVDVDLALTMAGHRPPVFRIEPGTPEARLLPLIRQVPWDERQLRMFEEQLRILIKGLRGEYFTDKEDSTL